MRILCNKYRRRAIAIDDISTQSGWLSYQALFIKAQLDHLAMENSCYDTLKKVLYGNYYG
jgi:hypothetical protein